MGKKKIGDAPFSKPHSAMAAVIISMAKQHGISYTPLASDAWADNAMRLAGDDVKLDEIEFLLIALQRSGHLNNADALRFQIAYLREKNEASGNKLSHSTA